uniref:Uncharacterized protein n=1 Tax=Panagrolaimus davidi TaxID=227884 RepID=A0A914PLG5_9BILA
MEVDDQIDSYENIICRKVNPQTSDNGLGEALNRERTETIDILQVIDWYPYIGIWLLTKEIPNYTTENISLTCSSDLDLFSVSFIESDVVLLKSPKYEGYRLWFATFSASLPFELEINTCEKVIDDTIVDLARKTFFNISSPHITYNNIDFFDATQIEHGIYFFISLGYRWKVLPLNKTIRGILNSVILSDKRFSGDITSPWNWGELISEHQTYVFIPPLEEEEDSEMLVPSALFGCVSYQYKGALIMSRDLKSVTEAYNILKGIIKAASSSDYDFIKNYDVEN